MIFNFISLENYRKKFYQRESDFKNFSELSEEELSILAKKVYRRQEMITYNLPQTSENLTKLVKYQRIMQYITNPNISLELTTFDKKIACLIMLVDPNLVTFKEFLKADLPSISEIAQKDDEEERNALKKKRNYALTKYEYTVRNKIGFYDTKLLKYEEMFFKKYFGKKELITEVGNNNQDNLIEQGKVLNNFNNISDERYNELTLIAQTWLSLAQQQFNYKVAAYSVTNQKELLGLNNLEEQLTLFILLVDSNLDMLRIYEEESKIQDIESRTIEQFGYFNKDLLILERKFHDRFCPNKEISVWAKTKKD